MEDSRILALYWSRDQAAVGEAERKYGPYCAAIARRILADPGAEEETLNDAWLAAWNSIPPHRPADLGTFLGKLTRRIAIDRWRRERAEKRGGGRSETALHELENCLSDRQDPADRMALTELLNDFLADLGQEDRILFVQRYWYFLSIREIAGERGHSESKVKMSLLRSRNKLRDLLEKEGIEV